MGVIWQALTDMVISGAGLLLVGAAYLLWWLSGFVPNLFSEKKWSWKRGLQDFCKVLLMAVILIAGAGLADVGSTFFYYFGWDIREGVEAISTFALIGAMSAGFLYYLTKAITNAINFFKLKWNEKQGNKEQFDSAQAGVQEGVKQFLETITGKTSKEDVEEGLPKSAPEREYIEVSEEEAGKGGVTNTYIEPYRSAPQDSMTDPSTCYNRECVSYVACKIFQLTGKWPTRTGSMNAKYWVERLAENGYKKIVDRPQNGGYYVGVSTAGTYGHVVWFEGGEAVSEYNYAVPGGFGVRIVNLAAYKWVEIKPPVSVAPVPTPAPEPAKKEEPKKEEPKKEETKKPAAPAKKDTSVSYTYKKGDTFGQVILNLGLNTSHGLWGPDGDVAYYNKQLAAQGITGNIPVGKTIKLTPRA